MGNLQTVINFVSSSPSPTPGGGGTGGTVQTGDMLFIVVAMLLCVVAASFLLIRLRNAKMATAKVGKHASSSSMDNTFNGKIKVLLALVFGVFAIAAALGMTSINSNSALAQNSEAQVNANEPLSIDKPELTAWVDEATGQVTIDNFTVTNNENDFFKFNTVTAAKKAEYNAVN